MALVTRIAGVLGITLALSCLNAGTCPPWPEPGELSLLSLFQPAHEERPDDDELVRDLPVCVAAESWSAGELGRSVLYQVKRVGKQLHVGYFVYWSTERPWGNNLLSYLVVPAFLVDFFYSHLFFLFPGWQRVVHGPGDVEGARVTYEQRGDGAWTPVAAVADDAMHREVSLNPADFVDGQGRLVLMTNVWSHQLGAKGARAYVEGRHDVVCFGRDRLAPLTERIANIFRLGSSGQPRRARPAWRL